MRGTGEGRGDKNPDGPEESEDDGKESVEEGSEYRWNDTEG